MTSITSRLPAAVARLRAAHGRRRASVVFLFSAFVLMATGIGFDHTHATFSGAAANDLNSVSAAPDLVAPTTTRTAIAKRQATPTVIEPFGFTTQIGRNTTYNVYAQPADTGNPASGVQTVTADVSAITPGQTAAPLTKLATPVTVGGLTYEWKSAGLVSSNTMLAGTLNYTLNLTDGGPNSRTTTGHTVSTEIVAPTATNIQTTNLSGNTGLISTGDTVIFTYSEAIEPESLTPGWTGAAALSGLTLAATNGGLRDTFTITRAGAGNYYNSGTVTLASADYVSTNASWNASATINAARTIVTVTVGTLVSGTTTRGSAGGMSWAPVNSVVDRAGNPMSTTVRTETGGADRDF